MQKELHDFTIKQTWENLENEYHGILLSNCLRNDSRLKNNIKAYLIGIRDRFTTLSIMAFTLTHGKYKYCKNFTRKTRAILF
ncbi:hypothetical protein JL739_10945 [Listeria welshimeri]|uniref:hypothetical protein n=1 Tax=Listeria welshimeri TaxID=1643 RepID=UPI0010BADC49|nr:hypothetical protein [Listeria welshimeri]MBS9361629.1 hypothetical protein [Listeria welshimeri]